MLLIDIFDRWFQDLGATGQDIFKTTIGPTVAILIFAATNLLQIYLTSRNRRHDTKHVLIGIYKEVMDNLRYSEKSELTNAAKDVIKTRIRDEDVLASSKGLASSYRPLIGITESSNFYDAVSAKIPGIKSTCLVSITDYYRSIVDQKQIAEAIAGDAFLCITVDSRCEMIDELWTAFSDSATKAKACLKRLDDDYPMAWFRQLRLDDVGTAHGQLLFFRDRQ